MNWRRIGLWCGVAAVAAASVLAIAVSVLWWSVPRVDWLVTADPPSTSFMERDRASGTRVDWEWTPLARVSPHLLMAILVSEDIEFFQHGGFSVAELRAAVADAWRQGAAPRGASTLTQQLARNLFLTPRRSAWRKLREATLTWKLERRLGKRRILELYVNVVQFGPGVFGAGAAARRYYAKSPLWLTPEESAALAAGLPRPSRWNPRVESAAYQRRIDVILSRMGRATFLWRHLMPLYPLEGS
jgi:monofunctional biosynthetic peptidoglycan transglycosylase